MTTVATDGVTLAADGRTTAGNEIVTETATKLHRLPDGSVVGESGKCTDCALAVEELAYSIADGRNPKRFGGEYTLLRLMPDGSTIIYWNELVGITVPAPAAVGSGAEFARGAMAAGASATKAVKLCTTLDRNSGGKVRSMQPKEPR